MRVLKILALILSLSGCAGDSQVVEQTMRLLYRGQSEDVTLAKSLNPSYRYLRLVLDGRPLLIALGFVEQDAATDVVTDVWYSGMSEVIKIKAGRIVAMTGDPLTDVTVRTLGEPRWRDVLSATSIAPVHFSRERDVALHYRFGIKEKVILQKIAKPANHTLVGIDKQNLVWFQESYEPNHLPASIFAVDSSEGLPEPARVVYSWQCLTTTVCFSMQTWGLKEQESAMGQKRP
jgi:hypothetical protein